MLASNKAYLLDSEILENTQTFLFAPTLGDFRWILLSIAEELQQYELLRVMVCQGPLD
jgi:hypothetical protein